MAKLMAQECPHMAAVGAANIRRTASEEIREVPSPALPNWKVALRFAKNPYRLISASRKECGDLFLLRLPGLGRVVFLCRAELLHEVYRKGEDEIVAGEMRGRILAELTGDKVSTCLDGAEFKDRRKVIAPYLNGRRVEAQLPRIVEFTEQLLEELEPGKEHELQPLFDVLTQKTITSIIFENQEVERIERLTELTGRYLEAFQWRAVQMPFLRRRLGPWSPWSRFLKRKAALYEALEAEVVRAMERDADPEADLMSALAAAGFYEDRDACIDAVVQEIIGLSVGGAETTSKGLSWTFLGLLTRTETLERLRRELDEVLGDRPLRPEDLKNLPYLDAVVQEGLRYQSVGPFAGPRLAKKDVVIGGYRIPAGTAMVQALHEVGRGPLFPDQETFDPCHFHGRDVKPRDWVPFGGGNRKCTGMGLALVELTAVVATLVQRGRFTLGSGSTEPVQAGIAYKPRNNMGVRYEGPRSPSAPAPT